MKHFEYPGVTSDQARRMKRLFKADDEGGDDAYAATLHYLLHTRQGAALLHRTFPRGVASIADLESFARQVMRMRAANSPPLRDRHQPWPDAKPEVTAKGFPMNRADELESIIKSSGGFTSLCKSIAAGRRRGITERELSLCAKGFAMRQFPHLSPDVAFTRAYGNPAGTEASRAFWDACETLKQVGFTGSHVDDDDEEEDEETSEQTDALDEINEKAKSLRKRDPTLTAEQAFTKAYEQNPELAKRERRQHGF
jgi:hypothetical protein